MCFSFLHILQNENKSDVTTVSTVSTVTIPPQHVAPPNIRKTQNTKPVNSVLQNEIKSEIPLRQHCTAQLNHNHNNNNCVRVAPTITETTAVVSEKDPMETKGLEELINFINGTDGSVGDKQHSAKAAKRARQKQRKVYKHQNLFEPQVNPVFRVGDMVKLNQT